MSAARVFIFAPADESKATHKKLEVSSNVGSGLGPGITWATESVLRALRGEVPDCVCNKEVIPCWEKRFGGASA